MVDRTPKTDLINVDLDIASRHDLTALVDALAPRMHVLFHARVKRTHHANFELGGSASIRGSSLGESPDRIVRGIAKLISNLPPARRVDWDRASKRCFDIGFTCGAGRLQVALEPRTVRAVADLGASIGVTLYPGE